MNRETLEKLKNNPHYKMSDKQKQELAEYEKSTMVEFGKVKLHNNRFNKNKLQIAPKLQNEKE